MACSMDDLAGLRLVVAGSDLSAVQPVRDRLAEQGADVRVRVGDVDALVEALAADPPEAIIAHPLVEAALRARLDPLALETGPPVISDPNGVRATVEIRRLRARQRELEAVFAAASVARAREAEDAQRDTLQRLLQAAGYRDDNTYEHTQRVGLLAGRLAR
jgi:response regulator RpfG family c-di-GMP phosphodiesterase